ncbi:hypothetical protein CSUI_006644, partial [Cystoisospora suis]
EKAEEGDSLNSSSPPSSSPSGPSGSKASSSAVGLKRGKSPHIVPVLQLRSSGLGSPKKEDERE